MNTTEAVKGCDAARRDGDNGRTGSGHRDTQTTRSIQILDNSITSYLLVKLYFWPRCSHTHQLDKATNT
jgi:hypothetical protein